MTRYDGRVEQHTPRRLTRSRDRIVGGVASGIADYLDIDPVLVRVGWVLAVVFGLPLAVIGYTALMVIMSDAPEGEVAAAPRQPRGERNNASLLAVVLIVAGGLFLMRSLPWMQFGFGMMPFGVPMWPLLLVALGVFLLLRRRRA